MNLTRKQIETKTKIEMISRLLDIDPTWAASVAMVESSLGEFQLSPTYARGVFQMTSIAMKDLLLSMETKDADMADIVCGIAFLKLLLNRHGSKEEATKHYCNPEDRHFYMEQVRSYMEALK